jgi:hypothetical protein
MKCNEGWALIDQKFFGDGRLGVERIQNMLQLGGWYITLDNGTDTKESLSLGHIGATSRTQFHLFPRGPTPSANTLFRLLDRWCKS